MICVLDCSYALAMLLPDEATPPTAREVLAMDLIAPWLWATEIASAALRAERRKRFADADAHKICVAADALGVRIEAPGAPLAPSLPSVRLKLALAHQLTPYDAAYIELALAQGAALASQDARMIAAAERVGLPIYS